MVCAIRPDGEVLVQADQPLYVWATEAATKAASEQECRVLIPKWTVSRQQGGETRGMRRTTLTSSSSESSLSVFR
jgi:hypothetical protein